MRVTHGPTGAGFDAPGDWEVVRTGEETTLAVLEPDQPDGGFRASLVLTAVDNGGLTFRDWQNGSEALLARDMPDYLVIDLEKLDLDGRPAGRRLAHYAGPAGQALVMEQWFTAAGGTGYTLTATIDSVRYPFAAEELATYGRSLRVPTEGGSPR